MLATLALAGAAHGAPPSSACKTVHISPKSFETYQERSFGTAGAGSYLIEPRSDQ